MIVTFPKIYSTARVSKGSFLGWSWCFFMTTGLIKDRMKFLQTLFIQFKNFRIYKDLYGKPLKCDWGARVVFLIQVLLIFGSRCNHYFWDIRLKIYWLPNFNMLFQLIITNFSKVNCLRVYRKLITWSTNAKGLLKHAFMKSVTGASLHRSTQCRDLSRWI